MIIASSLAIVVAIAIAIAIAIGSCRRHRQDGHCDLRHRPLLRFLKGNNVRMRWDVKSLLSEHPAPLPEPLHGSCPPAPTYLEVKTARDSLRGVTRGLDRLGSEI